MTEKQYRLNKWGTRLLKNNRPLFDWVNEADDVVDLLNEQHEEIEQLKKELVKKIFEIIRLETIIRTGDKNDNRTS